MAALVKTAGKLIEGSLAPRTRDTYNKVMKELLLLDKELGFAGRMPVNPGVVIIFLTQQFNKGFASTTLLSKSSAIAFLHKINNHQDVTQHFLVQKLLAGIKKVRPSADVRQPMSVSILKQCFSLLSQLRSPYEARLYKCMLSLGFFSFMRPGEMTQSIHNVNFDSGCS